MDELDRLERLNRLRESGALNQDEFEQQKARILEGRPSPGLRLSGLWVAVAVLALCAVVALVGFYVGTSVAHPPRRHERVEVPEQAPPPAPTDNRL
jgi:hypothetical protein